MNISAIAFTDMGEQWSGRLNIPIDRGIPVMQWTRDHFYTSDALLFIGACGIAVRAIAPLIQSKTTDPAVLVMDESGSYIIPILSGHLGGANALARQLAEITGAQAVITTATDVRHVPAIDTWAKENQCTIENPECIKAVSSSALDGRQIGVAITERMLTPPFPVTLWLRPRTVVIGIGCRRGISSELLESQILAFLRQCGISILSVRALSSIDVKRDEPAILTFAAKYHLPFLTYPADMLRTLQGDFTHSDFVEKTVGVDNVCERAAVQAGGRLLVGKTVMDSMTLALSGDADL